MILMYGSDGVRRLPRDTCKCLFIWVHDVPDLISADIQSDWRLTCQLASPKAILSSIVVRKICTANKLIIVQTFDRQGTQHQ